ncbi:MAG TPA: lmo0937 family membrane protein [Flavobacteriales bacterium]|nr:lmo0937 family membrane protein [Flavobacteriales bacterium]
MSDLLYTIAIILVIAWAIGFLAFNFGGIIHVLLIIAIIAVILRVIKGGKIL